MVAGAAAGSKLTKAEQLGVPVLGRIPMEEKTAKLVDEGAAELVGDKYVKDAVEAIEKL